MGDIMPEISHLGRKLALVLALSVATVGFGAQPASAAVEGNKTFNGYSHDIKVYAAGGALNAGPVAAAGVGCSDQAPLYYSVGLANVALAGVTLGTSNTTSQATKTGDVQTVTSTYQATGVRMPLLGLIELKADAITVTSTVNYDTAAHTFTNSSTMNVTNLKAGSTVPGVPPIISVNGIVAPDAGLLNVPGVATIGLHSTQVLGSDAAGVMGKMNRGISVQILGQTVSTVIGETYAALYGETDQNWLFGAGEGVTVATSDQTLAVGPLVTAQVPCAGGDLVSASLPSVTLPGTLGSLGAVTSTAVGDRSGLSGSATTTSQVAGVNLLGGTVTADVVSSNSHAETSNGGQTVSTTGTSSFANLVVAGVPVSVDTPVNTVIQLPAGVGYVVVNGRTDYAVGVETIPLVVHVNAVGPTPAIDIVVARSYAVVLGPTTNDAAAAKAMTLLDEATLQSSIANDLGQSGVAPKGLAKGWEKGKANGGVGNGKGNGNTK